MLNLEHVQVEQVKRLEAFQWKLKARASTKPSGGTLRRSLVRKVAMSGRGLFDYLQLIFKAIRRQHAQNIVFVSRNLVLYERFFSGKDLESAIFINYHQTHLVRSFAGRRVFNVGVVVGAIKKILSGGQSLLRDVRLFDGLYSPIRRLLGGACVYIPCYYDASGLALILNTKRAAYEVIEVQHGSVCNFGPYSRPVSFKAADRFIALDRRSAEYVRRHLFAKVPTKVETTEAQPLEATHRIENEVPVILYCSSVEVNGIHEKFVTFLRACETKDSFRLKVRLHPRELDRKALFSHQLRELGISFEFDESGDWLTGNPYLHMIVVTPWSSVVEEAHRNGIPSVVLDNFGKERFGDLIDGELCWFAGEPCSTLREAFQKANAS